MQELAKISLFLRKNRVKTFRELLLQAGVRDIFHTSGSMPRIYNKSFLPNFLNNRIAFDPGEYLSFFVPGDEEKNCIKHVINSSEGMEQGWGTIFSQQVSLKQGTNNALMPINS